VANLADLLITLRADPSGIEEGMSRGKKLALVGGAAIGGAVAAGALKAMDIGAANDKLAAQLGLTEAESARIGEVAGSLYAGAYGEGIGDVNTAVGAVMSSIKGMNKASSADLQAMTAKALDFATAFDVDVQRAVDVAGRAVNSGLAKDASEAFDLITAASQRVPANLREDVLDATDEYGQFFAHLGIKGPQAFGIMVDAAEKGMFGIDKVGDAIKEFTILSTDGSASTKDAFDAIGLNAKNMQTSILAGGDSAAGATQKIVDGLLGITDPGKQAETALALFGTPLEDLNVKDIPAFLKTLQGGSDAMEGFAGATDRMGATLNDNASTNLTSFKRQAEQAFVGVVGGAVIPNIEKAATWLAYTLGPAISGIADTLSVTLVPALKSSAEFIKANEGPIKVIAAVIAAIFIPHLVKLAVQYTVTTARAIWAWTTQKAQAIAGAASTAVAAARVVASWVVMGAQAMARGAMMAAAWLLAMGPIALVIAAVAGAVFLIIKYWDEIKAAITVAVKAIWDVIKAAFGLIKTVITTYVGMWVAVIRGAWNTIKAVVSGAVDGVVATIRGIGKIVGIVTGFFGDIVSGVSRKFGEVIDLVAGLPGRVLSGLGNIGELLLGAGKDLIQGFINGIGAMAGVVKDALLGLLPGPLKKFAGKLGLASPSKLFKDHGRNVGLGFVIGLKSQAKTIGDTMDAITAKVAEQVQKARDYAQGIRDAFRQSADLTGFQYEEKKDTGKDMLAQLAAQARQAEGFAAAIAKLRKGGLNMTSLDQLIGAGPDALDDAQRILSGGKGMVGEVNRLVGKINAAGNKLGTVEARTRFLQPGRDIVGGARSVGDGGGKNALGDVYVEVEIDGEKLDARVKKVTREKDRATKRAAASRARRAAPARA
jgi:phage-related protein